MIAHLKGKLVNSSPTSIIVDVGGIGYRIFIPASLCGKLPQVGEDVTLQTSFVVRELSQTLYGFLSPQERDAFEALMGVTGIGPKMALSVIGHLSLPELQRAVANADVATLSKVPGIGKKTAERLIIEMRDKLQAKFLHDPADLAVHFPTDPHSQTISDAMSALINLGYNQMTAQKAIKKSLKDMPECIDLAAIITSALKHV